MSPQCIYFLRIYRELCHFVCLFVCFLFCFFVCLFCFLVFFFFVVVVVCFVLFFFNGGLLFKNKTQDIGGTLCLSITDLMNLKRTLHIKTKIKKGKILC